MEISESVWFLNFHVPNRYIYTANNSILQVIFRNRIEKLLNLDCFNDLHRIVYYRVVPQFYNYDIPIVLNYTQEIFTLSNLIEELNLVIYTKLNLV